MRKKLLYFVLFILLIHFLAWPNWIFCKGVGGGLLDFFFMALKRIKHPQGRIQVHSQCTFTCRRRSKHFHNHAHQSMLLRFRGTIAVSSQWRIKKFPESVPGIGRLAWLCGTGALRVPVANAAQPVLSSLVDLNLQNPGDSRHAIDQPKN